MTKSRTDVLERAFRRLHILSIDEDLTTEMSADAFEMLDALYEELQAEPHAMGFTWTLDEIPDAVYMPLAFLLAVRLAPQYMVPEPEPESRAFARVRGFAFTDDRDDRRDTDDDGVISEAEEQGGLEAQFY